MKYAWIFLPLALAGCGGTTSIVSSSLPCHPPTTVMAKSASLQPVSAKSMTMNDVVQQWLNDDLKYNILKNNNDALIDWVNTYCQK